MTESDREGQWEWRAWSALVEVEVLVEKYHEDLLEIRDGGSVQMCCIVPQSMPHIGERRDYEMENRDSCGGERGGEGGKGDREAKEGEREGGRKEGESEAGRA